MKNGLFFFSKCVVGVYREPLKLLLKELKKKIIIMLPDAKDRRAIF